MAQIISKHPDRDSSEKQIEEIDSEIQSLQKENDGLNEKLLGRRRELHVLLQVKAKNILNNIGDHTNLKLRSNENIVVI